MDYKDKPGRVRKDLLAETAEYLEYMISEVERINSNIGSSRAEGMVYSRDFKNLLDLYELSLKAATLIDIYDKLFGRFDERDARERTVSDKDWATECTNLSKNTILKIIEELL